MPGWDSQRDAAVRVAAMEYVQRELDKSGGVIARQQLENFIYDGEQIKLIDQSRGIRNPVQLPATLTILTNPRGPYDDAVGPDGYPRYKIRAGEWARGDNRKLHEAFEREAPLIWLQTVRSGVFVATMPVYLKSAHPDSGEYTVALGQDMRAAATSATPLEKAYAYRLVKQRLHQPAFGARVLNAYRERCAVCALHRRPLLDAAHITPDRDERGTPEVSNGMALCKIHHAAFDANVIGIRPDYVVEVATDVLEEVDGPMLRHGLQDFHGRALMAVPRRAVEKPDPKRLEERYEEFRAAG